MKIIVCIFTLLLFCDSTIVSADRHLDTDVKYLTWFSNRAGLFSQFIQLKIMHGLIQKFGNGRILRAVPYKSEHYGDMLINMCEIFALPKGIECPPPTFAEVLFIIINTQSFYVSS
jgi:hypothetical protein